ncbi:hypothetical protein TIFTF001_028376 [Ficus carica]|uniref:Uncharacterized protein n=1 Tax=Ficus carica TaxID=3494 RepID=A0AA88DPT9_FICCA|nr:hypothetical protein TIFTF001_028376 [Ficus carica]
MQPIPKAFAVRDFRRMNPVVPAVLSRNGAVLLPKRMPARAKSKYYSSFLIAQERDRRLSRRFGAQQTFLCTADFSPHLLHFYFLYSLSEIATPFCCFWHSTWDEKHGPSSCKLFSSSTS